MNAVKISIIIPFYNEELLLTRCINSILSSNFSDYEIILINDGSTDCSISVVNFFIENHDNIFLINKLNSGVSDSRNIGISHSKGEYITFIDADDTINDDYLSKLYLNSIINGELFDIVVGGFTYNYSYANKPKVDCFSKDSFHGEIRDLDFIELEKSRVLNTVCNKLIRTTIIKSNKILFDTNLSAGEDTLFVYRCILLSMTISVSPYCGYNYWITGDGLYQRIYPFKMYESYINQLFDIKLQLISKFNFPEEEKTNYLRYLCANNIHSFLGYMTVSLQKKLTFADFIIYCNNLTRFIEEWISYIDFSHLSSKVNYILKKRFFILFLMWKSHSISKFVINRIKKIIIKLISK